MSVTGFMAKWGRNFLINLGRKSKKQKCLVDYIRDKNDDRSVTQFLIERDIPNELLLHEEVYWKQRAEIFWLNERDNNTKFFHACTSEKRKSTHLKVLENEKGQHVDTIEEMGKVVKNNFEKVFAKPENQVLVVTIESQGR